MSIDVHGRGVRLASDDPCGMMAAVASSNTSLKNFGVKCMFLSIHSRRRE
ncbi:MULTISPECIES: hypothetical protein [Rhizobium]|nr:MULTISPECIES: hypothetical protein [Rhizobium]MCZ3376868.1 hypothetical protein [Rhizobium sp. AG207R]